MNIILFLLLIIALIALSFRFPRLAYGIAAALAGLVVVIYLLTEQGSGPESGGFPLQAVTLEHMQLAADYGDSYRFTGRIKNAHGDRALRELGVRLTLFDCVDQAQGGRSCEVIGETVKDLSVEVPTGQARDFDVLVSFSDTEPRGEIDWEYELEYARSR